MLILALGILVGEEAGAADIGRIAQATAGGEVRFYEVDREAAVEALRDERRWLAI